MTPAIALALQRSIGNRAVARLVDEEQHSHGPGCGHESGDAHQALLLEEAGKSPSRSFPDPLISEAKSFYRNENIGAARLHDNAVAQRALVAMGAEAMTIGTRVFASPSASTNRELMGHELSHVDKNTRGVTETGHRNGQVTVTDPNQPSERTATAEGSAFAAGDPIAPSVLAQRAVAGDKVQDSDHPVQRTCSGPAPVQRMPDVPKPKTARQHALSTHEAVKEHWSYSYGAGNQGIGPEEADKRFSRPYQGEEAAQTLSHQAFLVYDAQAGLREQGDENAEESVNEREIQGMLINNRLLFASNFNESMELFRGHQTDGKDGRDAYSEIIGMGQSDKGREGNLPKAEAREYVERVERAGKKTKELFSKSKPRNPTGDATADTLRRRHGKPVTIVDISDPPEPLHKLLTDESYIGAIFLITFGEEKKLVHAEQKLMLALHRSGVTPKEVTGTHAIMGRYRGCLCCTAALRYYQSKFTDLEFDPNPGFYYWTSLANLYKHQAHVVQDPKFHEYMMELAQGLPSSSALSRVRPPEDAEDRHGPQFTESAALAARRGYRTASDTEGESSDHMDTDDEYKSRPRAFDLTYAEDSAGKLGKGSKTQNSQSRARATRIVSPEGREEIQVAYLNNDTEAETSAYKKWREQGASYAELRDIVMDVDVSGRSEDAVYSHVNRYVTGKTGHEKRDNTATGRDDIKRRRTGTKTEKKGSNSKGTGWKKMTRGSDDWETLLTEVKADIVFYGEWQRRESDPDLGVIAFSKMSHDLARFVADQRSTYTVSSMADLLHMQQKTFRTNLVKQYGEARSPQATDGDGDVVMEPA
ncbi:DUF4157 domain-containing protein [Streptomyces spiramenti]|uniref:eCIS core domain-containing protein n=1 Tax=Streptomyces spiramenti TaxID=2720606 RepID=UPI001FD85FBF|nr:DUF4157 domain-containing protein [Streptomyces spiramenti]